MSSSPPELTYFTDRDLGRHQFPSALIASGLQVERHADHFPDDAKDEDWLPKAGAAGWIVLTHDRQISLNSLELRASMLSGVRLFVLRGKATTAALAEKFLQVEHRVRHLISAQSGPFVAKVFLAKWSSRRAIREAVQLYLTYEQWLEGMGP